MIIRQMKLWQMLHMHSIEHRVSGEALDRALLRTRRVSHRCASLAATIGRVREACSEHLEGEIRSFDSECLEQWRETLTTCLQLPRVLFSYTWRWGMHETRANAIHHICVACYSGCCSAAPGNKAHSPGGPLARSARLVHRRRHSRSARMAARSL